MSTSSATSVGIIGAGARTALGRSLPASAAAVRARIAHVGPHPFLVDRLDRSLNAARAEWLPDRIDGEARFVALAKNAAKEALAPLLRSTERGSRLRVFVGLPEPRPGRPADLDDAIARALGKEAFWGDRVDDVIPIPRGHAAAILAIEQASAAIQRGEAELCLAGGVDSYLEVETMEWLEETGLLHTASRRWGFTPGEAAGFCLLASARWLEGQGLEAPLTLLAAASSDEPARIRTKTICTGAGLTSAFEGVLGPLRGGSELVSSMIGDLNGEPYRADELGFTLTRTSDRLANPGDVLAPAAYWGDVGAASGALFAGLAFAASVRGYGPRPTTLMWASSEGGSRAAALLRSKPENREAEDS